MDTEKLREIVTLHGRWLRGDSGGVRAELRNCNLRGSNLRDSNLRDARGVIDLPIGDPRGYWPVAVRHRAGWRIASGCRWFSTDDARAHWGSSAYVGQRWIADQYVRALDWIEAWDSVCARSSIR